MKKKRYSQYYLAAATSLITFLVYLRSLQNGFVNWDDPAYIYENPHIRSVDLTLVKWAFLDFYASNWHPLTWISHAMDIAVWGLDPWGHHLTSNIVHGINTFLVVVLGVMLADAGIDIPQGNVQSEPRRDRAVLVAGGITGLLFGLHPVHVESVAWVSERKDLLCALFFLLSLIAYGKYASSAYGDTMQHALRARFLNRNYVLAFGFFVLALLSKPMAVSLPVVLLLFDWYPYQRIRSFKAFQLVCVEKVPFIAAGLVSSVLTIFAQKAGGAMATMEHVPVPARLLVGFRSLVAYLEKMVLPIDLIPYYPYPKEVVFLSPPYLLSIAVVLGFTFVCLKFAKQNVLSAAWGYYVVTLIPVIGIIQVGGQAMADRYTYLPGLGPFFLLGSAAAWVSMKPDAVNNRDVFRKVVLVVPALLLFIALTVLTVNQIGIWKDSFTLWDHVIQKTSPELPYAYDNRGSAFVAIGQYDKAIEDFDRSLVLDPKNAKAYYNRGVAYLSTGSFDKAIASFNRALEIKPNDVDTYVNRGISYAGMGRQDRAVEDFTMGASLDRDHAASYLNRGIAYNGIGKKELALLDFQKACALGSANGCQAFKTLGGAGGAH